MAGGRRDGPRRVQCWWFIAGYVFFYTTFLAPEKTFYVVRDRWPGANPYLATTLMSFPLFYIFDMTLEGAAHGFGWWQYQYAFGPAMAVGEGHFPLLWPILEQVPLHGARRLRPYVAKQRR